MSASGNPNPNILFLDHVGVLGGAELNLIDMARHTRSHSHVILMAEGPLRTSLEAAGVGVSVLAAPAEISTVRRASGLLRLVRTIPHVLSLAWKIARRAKDFDLVWANSQKSFVIGCFAAALARRPLVWHMHDILTADHFSPANRRIAVTLANLFARRVVTVSRAGLQSFVDAGGNAQIATVVHNGIDAAAFASTDAGQARAELEQEFFTDPKFSSEPGRAGPESAEGGGSQIASDGKVALVGVFGRLTPWKGQDILIRALPSLPGLHALFVGEALFNEDAYADSLRKLAADLGVTDRAHFTGFRTDVAGLMSAVDIVAHTSTSPEPFGRVIVEAMLARRPVIAAAAGGAAEIISHGHDGVLIPPGSPALLAAAIRELLANPEQATAMASRGHDTAVNQFSLAAFLKNIDRVIVEVAGTSTGNQQPRLSAAAEAITS